MVAWGSELRLRRRKICFTLLLMSANSCSAWKGGVGSVSSFFSCACAEGRGSAEESGPDRRRLMRRALGLWVVSMCDVEWFGVLRGGVPSSLAICVDLTIVS